MRLLAQVHEICEAHNVPVSICGELGGRPLEALALLGLGFRRFSLPSASIGPVKRTVRSVNSHKLTAAVTDAMKTNCSDLRPLIRQIADAQGIRL